MKNMLLVKEIMEDLRIDKMTAYKFIHEKKIPAINLGTDKRPVYRIPRESYEKFKLQYLV